MTFRLARSPEAWGGWVPSGFAGACGLCLAKLTCVGVLVRLRVRASVCGVRALQDLGRPTAPFMSRPVPANMARRANSIIRRRRNPSYIHSALAPLTAAST